MTARHRASCGCGQLTITAEGAPAGAALCFCTACRKRTWTHFGTQARWPAGKVEAAGQATVWRRVGDHGTPFDFRFCPVCGTTLWYTSALDPSFVGIAAGCFDDPNGFAPAVSVYDSRRPDWLGLPETLERRG
ncbi:MAG: GFA family protein [Alphaproteobacteria bacterium]|nr:GFA family protein [Alphaproteobacteria bacterium]